METRWVVVDDRRSYILHKIMEVFRKSITSPRRQDGHELFKWLERKTWFELLNFLLWYKQVSEERRVMEGIKPGPAGHTFVIIGAYPFQGLHVTPTHIAF